MLLTTGEVAELLRICEWTLKEWRRKRVGPPFLRLGGWAIRYPWPGLVAYLRGNLFEPISKLRGSRSVRQGQKKLEGRNESSHCD
jgi:hypothetical protein